MRAAGMPAAGSSRGWQLPAFLVLAFAWSWSWWIPMAAAGTITREGQGWPTHLIGLLGPAIAAIVVTALADGRAGVADLVARAMRWRVAGRYWLLIAATGLLVLLPLLVGNAEANGVDFVRYSGAPEIGLLTVVYVLLVNGFGEEMGWRGFLAARLSRTYGLAATSLLVWVVWAAWHAPLFWVVQNFRDLTVAGVIGWSIGLLLGSVVLTWLHNSARSSILMVALWHTVFNFATATTAASGIGAAAASTLVMVGALTLLARPSSWHHQP